MHTVNVDNARTEDPLEAVDENIPVLPDVRHQLPENDSHYGEVRHYIEDIPDRTYCWASEAAVDAFQDIKYSVRIHWGLYSLQNNFDESWPFLKLPFKDKAEYLETFKDWNPTGFNADAWMELFAGCGLQLFAFTTKHHEGFSMYDTKTRVRKRINWTAEGGPVLEDCDLAYSIMETPFKRDVVKELCDAARERGIKIDLYYSHPDWYDADFRPYVSHPAHVPGQPTHDSHVWSDSHVWFEAPTRTPEETERMIKRHREQLTELLTNYGPIDLICLDMWLGPDIWPQLRETLKHIRTLQPDVMLRARGIGNYGDYYTPEGFVPGSKANTQMPWIVIYPLARHFSYDSVASSHKGGEWIVRNLVDCVAKGGGFQVGIGPDGNGEFHPEAVRQLREAGQWLKINGRCIYGAKAREGNYWSEQDDIRFTQSKHTDTIYAIAHQWPGRTFPIKTVKARPGSTVRLLGVDEDLTWRDDSTRGMVIDIPEGLQDPARRPSPYGYVFQIEG